jgi:hypothetical protein
VRLLTLHFDEVQWLYTSHHRQVNAIKVTKAHRARALILTNQQEEKSLH